MPSRDSRMRIVIEVQNNATGEMQKVTGELRSLGNATKDAGGKNQTFMQSLGSLKTSAVAAGAAIAGAAMVIKKAWDFAQEGATISRLEESTTSLAESMGGNMSRIVASIRAASSGTVSDYGIMQAAGRAMMLGLGADADKLANLMQVAMFRGRAMGLSSEQAFSDIVTGVGRLSPLILDNLGIVLDADKTYTEYAASIGKTADALSSAEKRQALLNRVLAEGNKMMSEAGGLADDTATAYERLSAAWENAGNRMKQNLGEAFAPAAGRLADMIDPLVTLQEQYGGLGKKVLDQSLYYDQYRASAIHAAEAAGLMVDEQGQLYKVLVSGSGVTKQVIDANYLIGRQYYNMRQNQGAAIQNDPMTERLTRERATRSEQSRPYAVDPKITRSMGSLSFAQRSVAFSASETTRKMTELQLFMQGPVKQADDAYISRAKQLQAQLTETGKKLELLRKQPWKKEELAETEQQYAGIKTQIADNAKEHELASKKVIFDLAQQRMAQDGLTQAEADALAKMAEKFGLIDEHTAQLWADVKQPVDEMSQGKTTADKWLDTMEKLATSWTLRVYYETYGEAPWAGQNPKPNIWTKDHWDKTAPDEEGFATGGSFIVPGTGGIDSQSVRFRATPGEQVTVTSPGKRNGSSGVTLKNYGTIIVGGFSEFDNYGDGLE